MKMLKTFTKVEADEMIPWLNQHLENLQTIQKKVDWLEVQIDLCLMTGATEEVQLNQVQRMKDQREGLFHQIHQTIQEIESKGCLLKDIYTGVVDFSSVFEGKVVYLSWQHGEKEVSYMHLPEEAFEDRKLIVKSKKKDS